MLNTERNIGTENNLCCYLRNGVLDWRLNILLGKGKELVTTSFLKGEV